MTNSYATLRLSADGVIPMLSPRVLMPKNAAATGRFSEVPLLVRGCVTWLFRGGQF